MTRWRTARRVTTVVMLAGVIVALVGATLQGVSTALERRRFQRPGRMVDIGEHQLHVHCTGTGTATGTPLVVLEAPLGGLSAGWEAVQSQLDDELQVCSYDRSGLGWSETGDGPFRADGATAELRAALDAVGARPPYVLVGREFGAALIERFAHRYPDEAIGLVLVDRPDPGSVPPRPASAWLARVGILRSRDWLRRARGEKASLSDRTVRAFGYRPDHLTRTASEARQWGEVVSSLPDGLPSLVSVRRLDVRDQPEPDAAARIVEAVRAMARR